MKESFQKIQKRLGVERSEMEWAKILCAAMIAVLGTFAAYLQVVLLGANWAALAMLYPVPGILLLCVLYRPLTDRNSRLQNAVLAFVGIPASYIPRDSVLRVVGVPVTESYLDHVSCVQLMVCVVECEVFSRRSGGYVHAGINPIIFVAEHNGYVKKLTDLRKSGTYFLIGEDGLVPASPRFRAPKPVSEPDDVAQRTLVSAP